mmetsp:Transcript_1100/g.4911  ORF Transcript_1100/g.4911 Transcript_1100/m.4911 type:complete len:267 (+) Transcript_1100:606-1406(+)
MDERGSSCRAPSTSLGGGAHLRGTSSTSSAPSLSGVRGRASLSSGELFLELDAAASTASSSRASSTSAGSMKVPCASSPVACTSPASASSPPDARMSRALAAGLGVSSMVSIVRSGPPSATAVGHHPSSRVSTISAAFSAASSSTSNPSTCAAAVASLSRSDHAVTIADLDFCSAVCRSLRSVTLSLSSSCTRCTSRTRALRASSRASLAATSSSLNVSSRALESATSLASAWMSSSATSSPIEWIHLAGGGVWGAPPGLGVDGES